MLTLADRIHTPPQTAPLAPFCWQGWRTLLPPTWNLVDLDGGYHAGRAVFTENHAPRLLLRWTSAIRPRRAASWIDRTRNDETSRPGPRKVWVDYSAASRRGVVATLEDSAAAIPPISDTPPTARTEWSVYNLSCTTPPGFTLHRHSLHAGDLALSFTARNPTRTVSVRQLIPARLALQRLILDDWLDQHQSAVSNQYRPIGEGRSVTLRPGITGLSRRLARRRRLFFARDLPPELVTYALHDTPRDRLVIVQGSDEPLLREVAETVGRPPELRL